MRMIGRPRPRHGLGRRLASEDGFTMLIALGVMMVVSLLVGAAFVATQGDIHNSQHDLDGKRAYYAARAGVNNFLYHLNQNTEYWQTCPTQATTSVPGSGGTASYSYSPMPANFKPACSTSDPIHTMIDSGTGSFRMKFTGYSGTPLVSRTVVAGFRRHTPLDFLWYTVYETLDPNTYSTPSSFQDCATLLRDGRPSHCTRINWITGDVINGPMYTQDQYSICGAPVFGRAGSNDKIETAAPSNGLYAASGCSNNAVLNGTLVQNAPYISPPPDNTALLTYAQTDGKVYSGTTSIVLNGNTASVTNNGSTNTVSLTQYPIIYVTNSSCTGSYSPYNVSYTSNPGCGNVFVSGNYTTPLTIAAANDIIINGNITTDLNGPAVAGLIANNFVRVEHGVTNRTSSNPGSCGSATNNSATTLTNPTIDAAILAIDHSFIVDNYDCGAPLGNLTINGAIAQLFRGTVGTSSGGSVATGYLKAYTYDDRLSVQEPPFLFDLTSASWHIIRETSCTPDSGSPATTC